MINMTDCSSAIASMDGGSSGTTNRLDQHSSGMHATLGHARSAPSPAGGGGLGRGWILDDAESCSSAGRELSRGDSGTSMSVLDLANHIPSRHSLEGGISAPFAIAKSKKPSRRIPALKRMTRALLSWRAQAGATVVLAIALCAPLCAQSLDGAPRSSGDYAAASVRAGNLADAQLAQGRDAIKELTARHPQLAERQRAAEQAVANGRRASASALEALQRGNANDQQAARQSLDRLLRSPSRVDLESAPAAPQARALAPIAPTRAPRAAPGPADLAATLDAPLSAAIEAKADELGNAPVPIFEWVRKNIALVPGSGSLQGAAGTLSTRRGNPTDQASLLVALLRAAGVHSRYVFGNVEMDTPRALRWWGVDRIEAVTELLTESGVPFETVQGGGGIAALRWQHVWVEAWIDLAPSRGAKHRTGDAWMGLDPSYKDLDVSLGPDIATWMALDVNAMRTAINAAAVVDQASHALTSLGARALAQQLTTARTRFVDALRSRNLSNAPVGELLPRATDATPDYPFFLGNLPYRVLASEAPMQSLRESDRHRVTWRFRIDDNGQPGAALLALDQPTVALADQAVDVRFVPASQADRDVLLALIPPALSGFADLPDALPAYLIELKAELWLGQTRLASSDAVGLGRTLYVDVRHEGPGYSSARQDTAFVGEPRGLQLSWHGGSSEELDADVDALQALRNAIVAGTPASAAALIPTLLRLTGSGHFAISEAYQTWLAGIHRVRFHRAPGLTSPYQALEVAAPFGVITTAWPAGYGISDVTPPHWGAPLTGGAEARFVHQSLGTQGAFGHLLLEQLHGGTGRSASGVFNRALVAQKPVYVLDPTQAAGIPAALPSALRTPIASALARGDSASFVSDAISAGTWSGQAAEIAYPAALGGTSFVYGREHADAGTHLTGASVSSSAARGGWFTAVLGSDAPPRLITPWAGELERTLAAGTGLVAIANNPAALGVSDVLANLLAGAILDGAVGTGVHPIIDAQLWGNLIAPVLSIAPLLDPTPPTVNLSVNPKTIDLGQSTTITASANDNRPGVELLVTAAGAPIALQNGQHVLTPTRAGVVPVIASARDAAGNLAEKREDVLVRSAGDNSPPVVIISTPADDAQVTQPVDVIGSVSDASLRYWRLGLRPGNSPTVPAIILGEGDQPVSNAVLGKVDPTLMFNGVYVLILDAEDANGLRSQYSVPIRVDGDMKIGHFQISFEEIEIPLQGIPIRITRTYDTRQSKEDLDFGYGWSIDYQNVRIRESRKLGFSWTMQQNGGGFAPFCVRPAGTPAVTITLPDGETEQFNAKWSPECQQFLPPIDGYLSFTPANGKTTSKLEQLTYGQLRWVNLGNGASNLADLSDPFVPVDPRHYRLTTDDGMVYDLDQEFGITKITDQAGNFVRYTRDGITHSTGVSVQFVRDAQDRITDIVLPDGRRLKYRYSAAGDLMEVADVLGQKTTFAYLQNIRYPHYLDTITDARGVRAVKHEYDDGGRLIATTDANGERIEYVHNIAGKTETIKNRRGHSTTYVYDANGWVLSETNHLGEQTLRTYDANGNELTRTDPLGRRTENTVDARGNVLTEKDALGNITTRTYGRYNQLYTEVDALNRTVVTNTYMTNLLTGDETSYLFDTKDALGNRTLMPHDICGSSCPNTGNLKSITDPMGNQTSFSYDSRGNVTRETDPNGNIVSRTYDAMNRLTRETRTRQVAGAPESLTTDYTYDGKGRLVETKHPDGSITRTSYNAIDKVETETDALGRVTRYEYNSRGEQTSVIHPDGVREETAYDPEGNVIAQTDRLGRTTKMVYDAANRLIETIHPDATPDDADNPRTRSEYDAAGQLTASIDERGQRTTYRYDLAGRQIEVKNALNQTMTTSYDVAGQRTQVTDALGRGTKFVYDAAGRLTETIHPDATAGDADNPRTRMAYDAAGRKIAETDEMGRTTRFAYDKLSRLVAVVLPNPATGANPELIDDASPDAGTLTTRYQYDEQGNKIAQIDAEGRTTRWTYDRQGRGLTRTLPMGQSESFQYDSHGQRVQHTTFNGEAIATAYDNLGRPTTVTLPGKTRTFSYDAGNRVTSIQEGADTYSFQYDVRDRLTRATDAQNRSIDYAYDAIGNRTRLSTPRQHVDYTYDELNRLTEVIAILDQGRAQTTSYAYDGVGNRAGQTHPNGTTVAYTYDERNRLKTLLHKASAAANAAILLSLSYSVDASGLRTQIAETRPNPTANQPAITRTTDYQYDAVKRLMREQVTGTQSQGRTTVFTYDKVGNRKTEATSGTLSKNQTLTYDNNDRLTRVAGTGGTIDHVYDNAGNLIEKKQGTTTLERYTFDAEGRLTTATIGTGASQKVLSYRYDPNGIRRSQHVETSTGQARAEYLVDPNQAYAQVLEEYETQAATGQALPASTLATTYVYGDDLISQTQLALAGNTTHVYHYDGLGTTRALSAHNLDAQGNPVTAGPNAHATITDRYAYTAFGENDPAGTSGNTTGTTDNNYRYTGEQLDPNLGFYYLRARYMDPRQGRFLGMDPWIGAIVNPKTLHRFAYAENAPTMFIDPSGKYTADFGRAVEEVLCDQYKATFITGAATECGDVVFYSPTRYFKPDIMDWGAFTFNEIKPLSPSGVSKGIAQIALYTAAYGPLGFRRNTLWWPYSEIVDGERVWFFNVEGVIFYTDDENLQAKLVGSALTLATISYSLKHASKISTRLGADAVLRAHLSRAIVTISTTNHARMMASTLAVRF